MGDKQLELSGKHVSICTLNNPAKFRLYLDYHSNFKSSQLALIQIEYKVEMTNSINSSSIMHCLTAILHFDNCNNNFHTNACLLLPVTSLHYIQMNECKPGSKAAAIANTKS